LHCGGQGLKWCGGFEERHAGVFGAGKMVRKTLFLVCLIVLLLSLIGCQTVKGVGSDIEWVGEKGAEVIDK